MRPNVQATLAIMKKVVDRLRIHAVRFCGTASEDIVKPVVYAVLNRLCER